jgi:hypothetical protein
VNRSIEADLPVQVVSRTSTLMGYKLKLVAALFHREIYRDFHQGLSDSPAAVLSMDDKILNASPRTATSGHVRHDEEIKSGHDSSTIDCGKNHS